MPSQDEKRAGLSRRSLLQGAAAAGALPVAARAGLATAPMAVAASPAAPAAAAPWSRERRDSPARFSS